MDSLSGKVFPTVNPTTGEKICDVAEGDKVTGKLNECWSSFLSVWNASDPLAIHLGAFIIYERGGDG